VSPDPSVYLGIDDTDNAESIGTGKLSRILAKQLRAEGLAASTRVTRHQLLVHPDVPYTSHNSSACIELRPLRAGLRAVADFARRFLECHFHEGANPGLCAVAPEDVSGEWIDFARRAQCEVLPLEEADRLSRPPGGILWWGGETGQGRIGALSAAALRRTGEDGRYISLGGIRELEGVLSVADILARSDIVRVETEDGRALAPAEEVDTQGWVRPSVRGGEPVLRVRSEAGSWAPAEPRKKDG
jgi:hypothetical protein